MVTIEFSDGIEARLEVAYTYRQGEVDPSENGFKVEHAEVKEVWITFGNHKADVTEGIKSKTDMWEYFCEAVLADEDAIYEAAYQQYKQNEYEPDCND